MAKMKAQDLRALVRELAELLDLHRVPVPADLRERILAAEPGKAGRKPGVKLSRRAGWAALALRQRYPESPVGEIDRLVAEDLRADERTVQAGVQAHRAEMTANPYCPPRLLLRDPALFADAASLVLSEAEEADALAAVAAVRRISDGIEGWDQAPAGVASADDFDDLTADPNA